MKPVLPMLMALSLLGCATQLSKEGQQVRIVTASQKERCESIQLITFNQRLGPDKPGNAMKSALNETAATGGNAFYVVSAWTD